MAITLNKYSAVFPDYAVLLIWLVPLGFLIVWLVKEEKSKAFRRHLQETPIAYGVMSVVFLATLVFTTSIVKSKVFAAKANVAKVSSSKIPPVVSPSLSPQSDPASVISQKSPLKVSPNHPLARAERSSMPKAVPAAPIIVGGDIYQETKGDCSPATIGSNNTNNCNVPPKINASPQTQIPTGNPAVPWATRFSIQSTALTQLGDLRVTSDGPVLKMEMTRINRDSVCNGIEYVEKDVRTAVFQVCSSEMMAPGQPVTITIYSLNPVRVVSGTFGANSITFQ